MRPSILGCESNEPSLAAPSRIGRSVWSGGGALVGARRRRRTASGTELAEGDRSDGRSAATEPSPPSRRRREWDRRAHPHPLRREGLLNRERDDGAAVGGGGDHRRRSRRVFPRLVGRAADAFNGRAARVSRNSLGDLHHRGTRPLPGERRLRAHLYRLDRIRATLSRAGLEPSPTGVRPGGKGAGRQRAQDFGTPHPAQRGGSPNRPGHFRDSRGDPGGGLAQLFGARRSPGHTLVGSVGGSRDPVPLDCTAHRAVSRTGIGADGPRIQLSGRCAARRARSQAGGNAMRAVVQRVSESSVEVEGRVVGRIGPGLLVLLGVGKADTDKDVDWMVEKVSHLRIFEDEQGKMNRSLLEGSRSLLAISQFTLYGDTRKGRRPSFVEAKEPAEANRLYELFCERARSLGLDVQTGIFAAQMKVSLVNDGPVTLILDSQG